MLGLASRKKLWRNQGVVGLAPVEVEGSAMEHVNPTGLIRDEIAKMLYFLGEMYRVLAVTEKAVLFSEQGLTR